MNMDEQKYRRTISEFTTGVTVVTAERGDRRAGLTVSAFTSVSMDPKRVLISVATDSRSHELLRSGANFTVNILGSDQKDLSKRFAEPGMSIEKRFGEAETRSPGTGGPILTGSLAYLACRQTGSYREGDHRLFLGEPVEGDIIRQEGHPLLYYRGSYRQFACSEPGE